MATSYSIMTLVPCAGVEIPFPQRDVQLRSTPSREEIGAAKRCRRFGSDVHPRPATSVVRMAENAAPTILNIAIVWKGYVSNAWAAAHVSTGSSAKMASVRSDRNSRAVLS
jgi:small-conductance mechanosensitive channel